MSGSLVRIGIIGAHSVGKTTLANALAEELSTAGDAVVAAEPIRDLEQELRALDPTRRYLRLLEAHFARLDQPGCEFCIYDRTLLDLLTYFRLEGPDEPVIARLLQELLRWYAPEFTLFIHLPIEIPLVRDDRRPPSEEYRARVDRELRPIAEQAGIEPVEITGDRDARVNAALQIIQERI